MPTSTELKKEIAKLEHELKEKTEVESLERRRSELNQRLMPQKKPSGFSGILHALARGEQRRTEMESKTPKKVYKAIKFEDIGFKA